MKYILAGIRLLFFFIFTLIMVIVENISYYVLSLFGKQFSVRINHKLTMVIGWMLRFVLGIRVKIHKKEKLPKDRGFLMVSNHLGYVELAALLKIAPIAFVAKESIGKWPVLGAVAKASGSVFVNRDKGGMSDTYINKTAEVLDNHINVWFSPEKTTTDGTWLRPFSSALFVAANRTKRPVVPVVFVLRKLNGKPISKNKRYDITWALTDKGYSAPFFSHIIQFMTFWRVNLEMYHESHYSGL
ncbi:MAG: 1-acyl-sn-glycerol-3-phosphate acyltransferase [Candidatus Marinimicrobia bacterium]|nr:1-acyl-sn-glycerol-3-phosphate acyltransferase [Candidatus Neomarinimicrobiota bacterium]